MPTQRDFARLDPRFRIAPEVWSQMPDCADYGFAVFKLRAGRDMQFHPMALRFPTRSPDLVFFPTVHVHEGRWNSRAHFDHTLYLQTPDQRRPRGAWVRSPRLASRFVRTATTGGLVDPDSPVYRREIAGERANADVLAEVR